MGNHPDTPFDSIENAQDYVRLLLESIIEAKSEVDTDLAAAEQARSERRIDALRLVGYKLETLEQHLRKSSRALNDLRSLRRLLLEQMPVS